MWSPGMSRSSCSQADPLEWQTQQQSTIDACRPSMRVRQPHRQSLSASPSPWHSHWHDPMRSSSNDSEAISEDDNFEQRQLHTRSSSAQRDPELNPSSFGTFWAFDWSICCDVGMRSNDVQVNGWMPADLLWLVPALWSIRFLRCGLCRPVSQKSTQLRVGVILRWGLCLTPNSSPGRDNFIFSCFSVKEKEMKLLNDQKVT